MSASLADIARAADWFPRFIADQYARAAEEGRASGGDPAIIAAAERMAEAWRRRARVDAAELGGVEATPPAGNRGATEA